VVNFKPAAALSTGWISSRVPLLVLPVELERLRQEIGTLEEQKDNYTRERDSIDKDFQVREAAVALISASVEKESAAARIEALTASTSSRAQGVSDSVRGPQPYLPCTSGIMTCKLNSGRVTRIWLVSGAHERTLG
jgi:hypothetical protein